MKKNHSLLLITSFLLLFVAPPALAVEEQCSSGDASCCKAPPVIENVGGCPPGRAWIGSFFRGSCELPSYLPNGSCSSPSAVFLCKTNTCYVNSAPACSTSDVNTGSGQPCCLDGQVAVRQGTAWVCADSAPPVGAIDGSNDANEIATNAEIVNYVTGLGYDSVDNDKLTGNGILPFKWVDDEVSDSLTIDSDGSVDIGALPVGSLSSPSSATLATTQDIIDQGYGAGGGGYWTENGSNLYYNAGNVGIGTGLPTSKLYVKADSGAAVTADGGSVGLVGIGPSIGVRGSSSSDTGVEGTGAQVGVHGESDAVGGYFEDSDDNTSASLGYGAYGGYFSGDGYFSGNVGVGTTNLSLGRLAVSSDVAAIPAIRGSNNVGTAIQAVGDIGVQAGGGTGVSATGVNIAGDFQGGSVGINATGTDYGGYFEDSDSSAVTYVGYGDVGIDASGSSKGGYFSNAGGSSTVDLAFNDVGILAYGTDMGGEFVNGGASRALLAYGGSAVRATGDTGVWASGDTQGGYFKNSGGTATVYVARDTTGVEGRGNDTGLWGVALNDDGIGVLGEADSTYGVGVKGAGREGVVGSGSMGVIGSGDIAGGYFEDINSNTSAYLGYGVYGGYFNGGSGVGVRGTGTQGVQGSGLTGVVGTGNGVASFGTGTGVSGTGTTTGVSGTGTTTGVFGRGNTMGGRFENTDYSTSAYLGYGDFGGYFTGDGYFSGNLGIGTSNPQSDLHVEGTIQVGSQPNLTIYKDPVRTSFNLHVGGSNYSPWQILIGRPDGNNDVRIPGHLAVGASVPIDTNAGIYAAGTYYGGRFQGAVYGVRAQGDTGGGYFTDGNTGIYGFVGYDDYSFYGNGPVRGVGAYVNSDVRLKEKVKPLEEGVLDKLIQLRGVGFEWKEGRGPSGKQIGFIAQEVLPLFPELVISDPVPGEDGELSEEEYYAMSYARMSVILTEAIRELRAEKDAEIEALSARIAELEAGLEN